MTWSDYYLENSPLTSGCRTKGSRGETGDREEAGVGGRELTSADTSPIFGLFPAKEKPHLKLQADGPVKTRESHIRSDPHLGGSGHQDLGLGGSWDQAPHQASYSLRACHSLTSVIFFFS